MGRTRGNGNDDDGRLPCRHFDSVDGAFFPAHLDAMFRRQQWDLPVRSWVMLVANCGVLRSDHSVVPLTTQDNAPHRADFPGSSTPT